MNLNEEQRNKLKGLFQEIKRSNDTIAEEKELQKEGIDTLAAALEVPAKKLRAAAKIYCDQNLTQKVGEFDDIVDIVENAIR